MNVCVYCSSSSAVDESYWRLARDLGRRIGERGHTLVYGGANVGLMGALAESAREAGARVIGVIPQRLHDHGLVLDGLDEMIITETMAERKAAMEERGDAYIALPGGFGTLEEVLQVLTLKQLGYLDAPVVLVDNDSFYEHLFAHFELLYTRRFAKEDFRVLYQLAASAEEALDLVESYQPGALPNKWF